jgi:hypothetical protein
MRKILFSLMTAVAGITLIGAAPSNAAEAPWCLRFVTEGYSVDMCEYRTFEACNQQRINEGNKSSCFRNPAQYFPNPEDRKPPKPKQG